MIIEIRRTYAYYFCGLYLLTSSLIFELGNLIPLIWNSSFFSFPNLILNLPQPVHPSPKKASIVLWLHFFTTRSDIIYFPRIAQAASRAGVPCSTSFWIASDLSFIWIILLLCNLRIECVNVNKILAFFLLLCYNDSFKEKLWESVLK